MRRSLRLLKDAHPVQRLVDDGASSLQRLKVLSKRHTILHKNFMEIYQDTKDYKLTTPLNEFKKVISDFPLLEKKIEKAYVTEITKDLTQPEIDEVKQSWKERDRVAKKAKYVSRMKPSPAPEIEEEGSKAKPDYELPDPSNPKEEDIGKFFTLTQEQAKLIFMNGTYGDYFRDHFQKCSTFDFMLREETLQIINMLKASQNINNNAYPDLEDTSVLNDLEPIQQLSWLISNHPQSYLSLYRKISLLMSDYIYSTTNIRFFTTMRNSADLFTATAGVLVQELAKPQLFAAVCKDPNFKYYKIGLRNIQESQELKSLVHQVLDFYATTITSPEDQLKIVQFADYVNHISPVIRVAINEAKIEIPLAGYIDLDKRFSYPEKLKADIGRVNTLSCGTLLTGMRGSGKSQILAGVTIWASLQKNWVVVKLPRGSDVTKYGGSLNWEPKGIYYHPEAGYDMLQDLYENNKDKLAQINVNTSIYGKYSLSGIHPEYDKDYPSLPNERIFLREEQVWTDLWKTFLEADDLEESYKGIRGFSLAPRISRFEYEVKRITQDTIPEIFKSAMNGDVIFKDLKVESLFDLHQMKRKPKKRMLPKDTADVLSLTLTPAIITAEDLTEDKEDIEDEGDFVQPLATVLPNPLNLKQLAEFGLKSPMHVAAVMFEIMEQLYRNDDFNVVVLVDEFSDLYKPSYYASLKYQNYKLTNGCIPPYDLSFGRLFMRFDGHMIKNGAKIVSVSEKESGYNTVHWKGDPLNLGNHFSLPVQPLTLDDMRKLIKYYSYVEWTFFRYNEVEIATLYMLSQGNIGLGLENIAYSPAKTY